MAAREPGRGTPRTGVRTLCPVLVGRERELALLRTLLDEARAGSGAAVVLRGEAGIGKSRLAREAVAAARAASMTTLVGRCVQQGQAPYRPLTEALLAAARAGARPDAVELRPFRHALGTLVPDWREQEGGEVSPVVLAEGVLRLARALGGAVGTLLVIEDLHWADPDTLAAVEYLADNLAEQPVALLATLRAEEGTAADELVARVEDRGAARVVDLGRLDPTGIAEMVAASAEGVTNELVDVVAARSDGVPLLVEELLSVPAAGISRSVPATFADAVARRVDTLPVESVLVVRSAAVLGRRFDWRLLPAVTGLAEAEVRTGLADAVGVQLLSVDADGEVRFRHALTRDAVLTALLPPTRVAFARRAAQAIEAAASDDDAHMLLAAELWCAADEPARAARVLLVAGRQATDRGRLTTAERLLGRARALPVEDESIRADAAEAMTRTLALAAKVDAAVASGAEALALLDGVRAPTDRRARLHLLLARAADSATRWSLARQHLHLAEQLAVDDERLLVEIDALAAHVAMGELRYDDAERLATGAADRAVALDLPEVACEALEVLGRRERLRDLSAAEAVFTRAHDIARDNDLALSSIRTMHELGTIDMFQRGASDRLRRASELAYRAGALSLAATVDLQLIGLHAFLLEIDEAVTVATRAVEVAGALGLTEVHIASLLQLGFAHALAGRRAEMEDVVERALRLAGDDHPEAVALAWGHARATASLVAEDRPRAVQELDVAISWAHRAPGTTGAFTAMSALVRVVEGAGAEAIADLRDLAGLTIPINAAIVEMARAVLDARAGERDRAAARVAAADAVLRSSRMDAFMHLAHRLLAEPALRDGWGDPDQWLTEAMAYFQQNGLERIAAACRDLLRRAGHRLPASGAPAMPERLRAAGVTSRELEVLRLLGERLSNREIAERLYLSPRTVEKHVERLLQKTGEPGRSELGRLARTTFGPAART
jgi:DNA-binding NarL/FixJ family response regulator